MTCDPERGGAGAFTLQYNAVWRTGDGATGDGTTGDGTTGAGRRVDDQPVFHASGTSVPCFTPGTMIATPKGEVAVENLRIGDRVITRDNGLQEVKWIGSRSFDFKELARAHHLAPILLEAGSLGNGLPESDMVLSPNHRVLVANDRTSLYFNEREVLAAAKHLVNSRDIRVVEPLGVSYLHFLCERHEVVLSNGAWSESFQPGDRSLNGVGNAQRQELFELYPELATREGLEAYAGARRVLTKHEAQVLRRS